MTSVTRWLAGGITAVVCAGCAMAPVDESEDPAVSAGVRLDTATQIQIEEQLKSELTAALPLHVKWSTSALGGERIRMVQLTDRELLVVTGRWGLYSINRNTGVINWFFQLRYPLSKQGTERRMVEFGVAEQFLYVLYEGDILGAIWRSSGRPRWLRKMIEFTPGTFLAGNDFYCYMGALDKNRLYAIREADRGIAWDYGSSDAIVAAPVEVDPTVYFSDLYGGTYAVNSANGDLLWRHQAARGTRADLYVKGGKLYVSSLDHALYALDRTNGKPDWVFETGGPIEAKAQVGRDTVYVRAIDPPDRYGVKGEPTLFAINEATGEERWRLRRGERLLARGDKFAYVLREGGVMVVVENETGRVRKPAPDFDGYPLQGTFRFMPMNDNDDVIFLGTQDGFFFALTETDPHPYK